MRTFAPFVAGISRMDPRRFFVFNVAGAALWVGAFVGCGYFFGSVPFVRDHLTIVVWRRSRSRWRRPIVGAVLARLRRRRAERVDPAPPPIERPPSARPRAGLCRPNARGVS